MDPAVRVATELSLLWMGKRVSDELGAPRASRLELTRSWKGCCILCTGSCERVSQSRALEPSTRQTHLDPSGNKGDVTGRRQTVSSVALLDAA